jgi:hypothetical protein
MNAAARRALGALVLLIYLPAYIALAAGIGGALAGQPGWALALFYGAAGFIWVAPLYPLFVWMRGRAP